MIKSKTVFRWKLEITDDSLNRIDNKVMTKICCALKSKFLFTKTSKLIYFIRAKCKTFSSVERTSDSLWLSSFESPKSVILMCSGCWTRNKVQIFHVKRNTQIADHSTHLCFWRRNFLCQRPCFLQPDYTLAAVLKANLKPKWYLQKFKLRIHYEIQLSTIIRHNSDLTLYYHVNRWTI